MNKVGRVDNSIVSMLFLIILLQLCKKDILFLRNKVFWTKKKKEKDTCTSVFIAALFTIARSWKKPKCPSTDEWIKKMWYIYTHKHTHHGILLSHKKEYNLAICDHVDGPRGYL